MTVQQWNAADYDTNARFVSDLGQPVLDLLKAQPGERILDLGCGDGALTERVAALGARWRRSSGPWRSRAPGTGARGRETLFPVDADLNLPSERYSFGIRRRAAEEATKGSFDEVDGNGVPMRHADLRPATQAAASERQRTLSTRLTKGEKRHTRRMAQVAVVYTTAPFERTAEDIIRELGPPGVPRPIRPRPEGKRVWASLSKEPAEATPISNSPGSRRQHADDRVV